MWWIITLSYIALGFIAFCVELAACAKKDARDDSKDAEGAVGSSFAAFMLWPLYAFVRGTDVMYKRVYNKEKAKMSAEDELAKIKREFDLDLP